MRINWRGAPLTSEEEALNSKKKDNSARNGGKELAQEDTLPLHAGVAYYDMLAQIDSPMA